MAAKVRPASPAPSASIGIDFAASRIATDKKPPIALASTNCVLLTTRSTGAASRRPIIIIPCKSASMRVAVRTPAPRFVAQVEVQPVMALSLPDSKKSKKPNSNTPGERTALSDSKMEAPLASRASGNLRTMYATAQAAESSADNNMSCVMERATHAVTKGRKSAPTPKNTPS